MSRRGDGCDNAAMESFFSTLKIERPVRKVNRTRDQLRAEFFDYVERFNQQRRHSTLDLRQPGPVRAGPNGLRKASGESGKPSPPGAAHTSSCCIV